VRDYPLAVLRRNIGMVPQETFLFSETIRENLTFGAPHASPEEMLEATEAAHIRQEFEEFPQGFETMVGERGVTLSGGQKQRAAIARALLRRPPFSSSTTRWPAWTPTPKSAFWAGCAATPPPRPPS
jgi:ATP-binding cassette subfamily B multidrug efflux pump